MRIIFSRKGFDSTAGGAPSPIVEGKPISLPIPATRGETTTYGSIGLGELAHAATKGRLSRSSKCHDDPLFAGGSCWFGQCGSAQGHLARNGVVPGDIFLFFGLFAHETTGERHHRIFGYLKIEAMGSPAAIRAHPQWREPPRTHPHLAGDWPANNTLYCGQAAKAGSASPSLRLTREGGPLNLWKVPRWLRRFGLTYHGNPERWIGDTQLDSVKRGQEFVCDIGDTPVPRRWLEGIIAEIEA